MCYYTKVHFNIIPTIHKKYRKQNKEPKRKITTGRGVVLAKKQFSPTVSFSASAGEISSDFSTISKGRRTSPSY